MKQTITLHTLKRQLLKAAIVLLTTSFIITELPAQIQKLPFLDSAQLNVGTTVTVASQDYQPLWLVSQRWGSISDQQFDASTYARFHNKHMLSKPRTLRHYIRSTKRKPTSSISYGLTLRNNQLLQKTFIQEGYAKIQIGHWRLAAGRYQEVVGEVNPMLSSGSWGISGNAVPIPQVSVGLSDYTDLPFFNPGRVQVKGQVSVGWLGSDTLVKNAMYQQRSAYLKIGQDSRLRRKRPIRYSLYGGFNQFTIWGGERSDQGKLPGEWLDLMRVVVPGNNLGFFDYGATLHINGIKIRAYTQSPFESRYNLNPLRIKDRIVGFEIEDNRRGSLFPTITLELINTTWQDPDPENTTSATDYNWYNNERYPSGWSYRGRILGTALFFNRERAISYFGNEYQPIPGQDFNIVNNRLNGVHIGVKGKLPAEAFSYRTLATYTLNHGNYYVPVFSRATHNQLYLMQEFICQYNNWKITGALGVDTGGLTNNVGALLGAEYEFLYRPKKKFRYRGRRHWYRKRR